MTTMKRKRSRENGAKKTTLKKQGTIQKPKNDGTNAGANPLKDRRNNSKKRRNSANRKKSQAKNVQDNEYSQPNPKNTKGKAQIVVRENMQTQSDVKHLKATENTIVPQRRKLQDMTQESVPKPSRKKNSKKQDSIHAKASKETSKPASPPLIPPIVQAPTTSPTKPRPTRRKSIVIDGTSAAAALNGDMRIAVTRAIAYYEERDVQAFAVVPFGSNSTNLANGTQSIVAAPPGATTRHVALREAARRGCDILSNSDLEHDLARQKGRSGRRKMRRFLQRHWIPFTFIDGQLLPNPHPRRLLESVHAPRQFENTNKALRIVARVRGSA